MTDAKKLFVKTYGCQMNVYDSERMADVLRPLGYAPTETAEDSRTHFGIWEPGVMQLFAIAVFVNCLAQGAMALVQGLGRADVAGKLHLAELPAYGLLLWWFHQQQDLLVPLIKLEVGLESVGLVGGVIDEQGEGDAERGALHLVGLELPRPRALGEVGFRHLRARSEIADELQPGKIGIRERAHLADVRHR